MKKKGPLDELKDALRLGLRIVGAAEPLAELQDVEREHREDSRIEARPRPSACPVCQGTLRVLKGPREGDNCPKCVTIVEVEEVPTCLTCSGEGKLGAPGHRIPCPMCKGKGS